RVKLGNHEVAVAAVAALATDLKEETDEHLRSGAAGAPGRIGKPVAPAVLEQITALNDADPRVRSSAAVALIGIGAPAAPPLIAMLKDTDPAVCNRAVIVLSKIGAPAVPALAAALKDNDKDVRGSAALALASIGKPAARAVRELIAAFKD